MGKVITLADREGGVGTFGDTSAAIRRPHISAECMCKEVDGPEERVRRCGGGGGGGEM